MRKGEEGGSMSLGVRRNTFSGERHHKAKNHSVISWESQREDGYDKREKGAGQKLDWIMKGEQTPGEPVR